MSLWGPSRHGHRHHRKGRSRRSARFVLLTTGLLSLLMGSGLLAWSAVETSPVGHLFGCVYLAGSVVCCVTLLALHRSRAQRGAAHRAWIPSPESPSRGFALLLVLLLLAVLSGVLLHATLRTGAAVRQAASLRAIVPLRLAAEDAAWQAIRRLADPGSSAASRASAQTAEVVLPSAVKTAIAVRLLSRNALSPTLNSMIPSGAEQVYEVQARALQEDRAQRVRSVVAVDHDGSIRVVAWIEG